MFKMGMQYYNVNHIKADCQKYGFKLNSFILAPKVLTCYYKDNSIVVEKHGHLFNGLMSNKHSIKCFRAKGKLKLSQTLLSLLEQYRDYQIRKAPIKWIDLKSANVRFFYNRLPNRPHARTINRPLKRFKYGSKCLLVVREQISGPVPVAIAWNITTTKYLVHCFNFNSHFVYGVYCGFINRIDWSKNLPPITKTSTLHTNKRNHRYYRYIMVLPYENLSDAQVLNIAN